MAIFPTFFFLLFNNGKENVFYDILERKIAFLGYKNKNFKKSKNFHFFQVLNPWFWPKKGHYSNFFFFLRNKGKENVFYDIRERKIAFLAYKNMNFKRQKIAIFPFFLGNKGSENVYYDILERKIASVGYKTKKFK